MTAYVHWKIQTSYKQENTGSSLRFNSPNQKTAQVPIPVDHVKWNIVTEGNTMQKETSLKEHTRLGESHSLMREQRTQECMLHLNGFVCMKFKNSSYPPACCQGKETQGHLLES